MDDFRRLSVVEVGERAKDVDGDRYFVPCAHATCTTETHNESAEHMRAVLTFTLQPRAFPPAMQVVVAPLGKPLQQGGVQQETLYGHLWV